MQFHKAQSIIAKDNHRFRVVCCGRRFGKTTLSAYEIVGFAVAKKDRRIPYYAPTREDARDIMWGMLIKIVEPVVTYTNESRLELKVRTVDGGESLIVLHGWESVKDRGKGRGVRNDFIVLDEVSKYKEFWAGWYDVLRPTLTDTKGGALFTFTPEGFNHAYDLYNMERKDPDFKSFHFTSYDNTLPRGGSIDPAEIEKAKKELPDDRFAQEYMADFRKMEGLVYKEFNRDKHIYDGQPNINVCDINVPVDFGFTNPCAILKVVQDNDGRFFVTQEYYKTEKTTPEIIEISRSFGGNYYYPDPAEPDRIEEMRRAGLNVMEVSKDIEAGINIVREMLKTNRLFIHSSCVNLIAEFESYRYPEKKPDKNTPEIPIKEMDHALDALRYCLYMKAGKKTVDRISVSYSDL